MGLRQMARVMWVSPDANTDPGFMFEQLALRKDGVKPAGTTIPRGHISERKTLDIKETRANDRLTMRSLP